MSIEQNVFNVRYSASGAIATGDIQAAAFIAPRPCRLLTISANLTVAPATTDVIIDIKRALAATPATLASIYGTVSQQGARIRNANLSVHPDQVLYNNLSTTQQQAVAASNPPAQLSGFKYTGFGYAYDFSTGIGGSRPTLYGAGAPAATVGVVGDWYIDTTNFRLYGPKQPASGVPAAGWPTGFVTLTGLNATPLATQSTTGVVPNCDFATGDTFVPNLNQVGTTTTGSNLTFSALFEWI